MNRALALLGVAAWLAVAACAGETDNKRSDWENANAALLAKERDDGVVALPPPPAAASLVEIPVGAASDFRFYVDAKTLAVHADGIIRYVLLARSPSGAENITYEGLNCRGDEYRIYATGRRDGSWERLATPWRPLAPRTAAQRVLQRQFLCPARLPVADAAEGAMALRRGGHPRADDANPVSGSR